MKLPMETSPVLPVQGYQMTGVEAVRPARIAVEQPKQSSKGSDKIRIAKIDPFGRRAAIIQIRATMAEISRIVGSRSVAQEHVATIDNGIGIWVACKPRMMRAAPIWRIRDGLPIRGMAVLFGNAGGGAADFPADELWLEEFVVFAPVGQNAPDDIAAAANDAPEPQADQP